MKQDVDVGLGADFRRFHREKAAASRAMPTSGGFTKASES